MRTIDNPKHLFLQIRARSYLYLIVILQFVFFTSSCYLSELDDDFVARGISPKKQKQKISVLQKKLEIAEIDEAKAKHQVEILRSEVEQAELSLVRKTIRKMENVLVKLENDPNGKVEKSQIDGSKLFLQEREILHRLIESGPSPAAFEAQVLLDQVLRMITNLSDETVYLSRF